MGGPLRPVAIRRDGDCLLIDWSDGLRTRTGWGELRGGCPCATCREERDAPPDPFRILTADELKPRPPIAPTAMTPVGHYAYKIVWNDGHDAGIYTIENLRAIAESQLN